MSLPNYIPTIEELHKIRRTLPYDVPRRNMEILLPLYREQFKQGHSFAQTETEGSIIKAYMKFIARERVDDGKRSWCWVYEGYVDMNDPKTPTACVPAELSEDNQMVPIDVASANAAQLSYSMTKAEWMSKVETPFDPAKLEQLRKEIEGKKEDVDKKTVKELREYIQQKQGGSYH